MEGVAKCIDGTELKRIDEAANKVGYEHDQSILRVKSDTRKVTSNRFHTVTLSQHTSDMESSWHSLYTNAVLMF